jgi:hypothetical protein
MRLGGRVQRVKEQELVLRRTGRTECPTVGVSQVPGPYRIGHVGEAMSARIGGHLIEHGKRVDQIDLERAGRFQLLQ